MLEAATLAISMDEPCWGLSEENLLRPTPGGRGTSWRRIQRITVMRQDRPTVYEEDLGPEERFPAVPFTIPGGVLTGNGKYEILHTVGELREIAGYLREARQTPLDEIRRRDLIKGYYDDIEVRPLDRRRASSFGPAITRQRGPW
jgi:hypothetical protein